MKRRRINCLECQYYYVTWDPQFPRGCRAFNFKTASIPSVEVFNSSGKPCLHFKKKR